MSGSVLIAAAAISASSPVIARWRENSS